MLRSGAVKGERTNMSREEAELKIRAAAYAAAADLGVNEAVKILEQAIGLLRDTQWQESR